MAERGRRAAAEDWLGSAESPPTAGPRFSLGRIAARPRHAVTVAAVAVVVLLIGLAAGGVFSGGSPPRATATTTPPPETTSALRTQAKPVPVRAPTTPLKPGDHGPEVKALQRALASLGYSSGGIDGQYGPATKDALARFQHASRLTADGILGPKTLAALTSALESSG